MSDSIFDLDKLEKIADVISGFAFKSAWFQGYGTKVIRIGDIKDGIIDLNRCVAVDPKINNIPDTCKCETGDILMALSGATTGKTGVIKPNQDGAFVNQRVAIIRGKTLEARNYLKYVFTDRNINFLLRKAGGAAQANLSPKALRNLLITIPSVEDQRRIAAILDKADAIRRKRHLAIQLADGFLRSVFLDMFGDPAKNQKGWPIGTIRDLVTDVKYGTSKKASVGLRKYPILRMNNITYKGALDLKDLKYIDLSTKEEKKYLVRSGDILFNRTNSKELVGKTAVYDLDEPMAIAGYLIRVRTNAKSNPYYISAYLNSLHGKKTLLNMCKSIIGMANINAQELQEIRIIIPPIYIQDKFAAIAKKTKKISNKLTATLETCDLLFKSLSQRAFRGEL